MERSGDSSTRLLGYILSPLKKRLHTGTAEAVLVTSAMAESVVLAESVESVESKEFEAFQFVCALLGHHQEYSR